MTGYPVPLGLATRVAGSVLTLQRRSFAADAQVAVASLKVPLTCSGVQHIPARGPLLVVCNHYSAPHYAAWWTTFAISAAIAARRATGAPAEVQWVITSAWRGAGCGLRDWVVERLSRWAFRRVAQIYGFVNMPPMPPRSDEVAERAASVLRTVRLARRAAETGGILGLAPEGQDFADGLGPAQPGAGEFIALLVQAGLAVLPAAVTQAAEQLGVRFGPVFNPYIPPRKDGRDAVVAGQVMSAIAACITAGY